MKSKVLIIALFLFPASLFSQSLTDSLAAKFLFSGDTKDSSGKNRHASIVGSGVSLTTDRNGKPNSAYLFTGKGGSIRANIGKHTEEVTVTLWYYSDAQTTPYPHFFDYGDYKLRCHVMWGNIYNSRDQFGILYESYNSSGNMLRGKIKPKDSTWTHVAVTFNKNTKKEKIFINGIFDSEMTIGSNDLNLADDIFCIGRVRSGATSQTSQTYFNGKLDDIHIYSRELRPKEIEFLADKIPDDGPNTVVEADNSISLSLYPNPTSNELMFNLEGGTYTQLNYSIYDINGKVIIGQQFISSDSIDISNLKVGVYYINFISEDKSINISSKFVKN